MIDPKELKHLEKLSKIALPLSKEGDYSQKLSSIIAYVDGLASVPTPPLAHSLEKSSKENTMREDIVEPSMPQEDVLMNSRYARNGYFAIPHIIEE